METLRLFNRITINNREIIPISTVTFQVNEYYRKVVTLDSGMPYTVWDNTDGGIPEIIAIILIANKDLRHEANGDENHLLLSYIPHVFSSTYRSGDLTSLVVYAVEDNTRLEVLIL